MLKSILLTFIVFCISYNFIWSQIGVSNEIEQNIQSEIKSKFGNYYEIFGILNVDSSISDRRDYKYFIEDPYNTLEHCFIFTAFNNSEYLNSKGFLGIFKNNEIIAFSDTVMSRNDILESTIWGSTDLNNDGNVEIMINNIIGNGKSAEMWIFSYSGNGLKVINKYDEYGSEIQSDHIFKVVDIESDNIYEIICGFNSSNNPDFEDDPEKEKNVEVEYYLYKWNGQYYSLSDSSFKMPLYFPKTNIEVELKTNIKRTDFGFLYKYVIINDKRSKQMLDQIVIECNAFEYKYGTGRNSLWIFTFSNDWDILRWFVEVINYVNLNAYIKPGEVDSTFKYEIKGLPTIARFYAQGHNGDVSINDKYISVNSFKGYTIGPKKYPDSLIYFNFIDTLQLETNKSKELGWIKTQQTADKYSGYFTSAKTALENNNIKSVRTSLEYVLRDVDIDSTSAITSEAYALLRYNTEYLLSKLPLPPSSFKLTVNIIGNGSVTKSPELAEYDSSSTVKLIAVPQSGYKLKAWSGDITGNKDTLTVIMNSNKALTAEFTSASAAPVITSLNPAYAIAGMKTFALTVNGSSFVSGAAIQLRGILYSTEFISSSALRTTLQSAVLTNAGIINITVKNPDGDVSNSAAFKIITRTTAIDSLINMVDFSCSNGCIKNKGLCNSFTSKLDNAKKNIQKGNLNAAKGNLNAFINELQAQRAKGVCETGYTEMRNLAEMIISSL